MESKIQCGDCLDVCKTISDTTFDLIITSPPYADNRKKTYGGISPDKYVEWFLPRSEQFLRILKPSGTFILNIKEKVVNCERHTYVLELILALRKQGWLWTEEFIWHKKNSVPGKWPNRFRDGWERCLQFNKTKDFKMYQDAVMVPVGDWTKQRIKNLGKKDNLRMPSSTNSGFSRKMSNWIGREMVYPDNVLYFATESSNKSHSAVFPKDIPQWFIKLFTEENDWVLDPFSGSGTTCLVANGLRRKFFGIDIMQEYADMSNEKLNSTEMDIFSI